VKQMSRQGLEYLTDWEGGMHLDAYDDGFGYMTIGVGHLIQPQEEHLLQGITHEVGLALLAEDVTDAEDCINRCVQVPLNQHQFDALCCWTFNIGVTAARQSTLIRLLNEGDYEAPERELPKWRKSRGKVVAGLENRRSDTVELWRDGDYQRDY